mmetsp:Transcript_73409/g.168305  ORF Transcript_73409/g.168305 Transcript_73409/m.168305 type:complete len:227 (-) Transcript_73409:410-1090(-)
MYLLWQLEHAAAGPLPQVDVHVYDFGGGLVSLFNTLTSPFGKVGAYHVGVEVYGEEWSYGVTDYNTGGAGKTGIRKTKPKSHPLHRYRESVSMGETQLSSVEVQVQLSKMRGAFLEDDYHLLRRNCITFAQEFVFAITGKNLPQYILEFPIALDRSTSWMFWQSEPRTPLKAMDESAFPEDSPPRVPLGSQGSRPANGQVPQPRLGHAPGVGAHSLQVHLTLRRCA